MNKPIYLDNNATTEIDKDVFEAMLPFLKEKYGNPSSLYTFGKEIKEKISESRKIVADYLNANEDEIVFTSCASESNVTAILNAIKSFPEKKHIITSKVEHASIMECMEWLEKQGYRITYLSVDEYGRINLNELESSIDFDTCLITIMMANNEIGNIYPIQEIGEIAKKHNVLFHCDAVQAIGKIEVDTKKINVDTLSFSGHKIYAPKGIGVLYVKEGTKYNPLIFGHQEKNKRGGTENVPYIIALGKAVELLKKDGFRTEQDIKNLRDYMEDQLKKEISDIHIYGDIDNRIPNTSNIAFKGVTGDELLFILEANNIFISTGSACNSQIALPSHVLTACKADLNNYSPIRISLGKYNTKEEIDTFINVLKKNVELMRRRK